ncbi:hypothetical protein ACIODW_06530 [Streptomyces sp. NPDC087897]|uniref:hypothetical protein n=1 Tax=Streptomyces sp. NPDC087897 TaxID=3365817 RepID=UPI00380002BA
MYDGAGRVVRTVGPDGYLSSTFAYDVRPATGGRVTGTRTSSARPGTGRADDETGRRTRSVLWGATSWDRDAGAYTPLRFPGRHFDPESGLHYNRHRTADALCPLPREESEEPEEQADRDRRPSATRGRASGARAPTLVELSIRLTGVAWKTPG